jgi:hypothetical protein
MENLKASEYFIAFFGGDDLKDNGKLFLITQFIKTFKMQFRIQYKISSLFHYKSSNV